MPTKAPCFVHPVHPVSYDGKRIRMARDVAGFTQEQLAERVGCKPVQVSRWETNAQQPKIDRLEAIAAALGRPVSFFFSEPDPPLSGAEQELLVRRLIDQLLDVLDQRRDGPLRDDQ